MSDKKYGGPIAAAKIVTLIKAALGKKLDKSGGTVTGSLEINGDVHAGGAVQSDLLLSAPSVAVHNGAGASVHINCSGDNAAEISSLGNDGKSHYSRFAVGTPTGDNDAATKAYVDDHAAGYEVITVTSTNVSDVGYDASEGAHKFAVTFDASFDSILANLAANKPMKFNITIPDNTGGFPLSFTTGYVSALNNFMYEFTGTLAGAPVVLSIGRLGSASVYLYADYLPDPNPDDSDDGKALVVNKHKWEMKKVDAVTEVATEATNGLMSASDKAKLNGIATGATRTTVDRLLLDNSDNPVSNRVLKAALDAKAYKTVATAKADGLMSASDKSKLGGIEYGANKTIVDAALDAESANPVQNKVVKAALDKKAGTAVATTSANGLMSKADKTKLNDIERGANKTTIDSAMSGSSVNPVQNKVIKQYIDDKVAAAGSNITVDAELPATSTNPVQNKAVKAAIDGKADKTALNAKMDKSGGTFTGNVHGKYFCGTWLQSTEASDLGRTPGKIAVMDDSGWVYYRTPAELCADLGIANAIKSYVDTAIAVAINSAY